MLAGGRLKWYYVSNGVGSEVRATPTPRQSGGAAASSVITYWIEGVIIQEDRWRRPSPIVRRASPCMHLAVSTSRRTRSAAAVTRALSEALPPGFDSRPVREGLAVSKSASVGLNFPGAAAVSLRDSSCSVVSFVGRATPVCPAPTCYSVYARSTARLSISRPGCGATPPSVFRRGCAFDCDVGCDEAAYCSFCI